MKILRAVLEREDGFRREAIRSTNKMDGTTEAPSRRFPGLCITSRCLLISLPLEHLGTPFWPVQRSPGSQVLVSCLAQSQMVEHIVVEFVRIDRMVETMVD